MLCDCSSMIPIISNYFCFIGCMIIKLYFIHFQYSNMNGKFESHYEQDKKSYQNHHRKPDIICMAKGNSKLVLRLCVCVRPCECILTHKSLVMQRRVTIPLPIIAAKRVVFKSKSSTYLVISAIDCRKKSLCYFLHPLEQLKR